EGRLRPSEAHAELRIPRAKYDAAGVVAHIADSAHVDHLLDNEEPPFIHYSLLKKSLAKYRTLRADSSIIKLPLFPKGKITKPGDEYMGLGKLRALLTALGDLPLANYAPNKDTTVLLGDVLEGVRHFQKRTGLESDGNIGPMTISALRKPFDSRLRTIELSLERWRWLPRNYSNPPILVNLPAFKLFAYSGNSDDERDVLAMDVAIGGSFDKKTPIFSDTLRTIVFSPYWDVPISISTAEIIPKARKDIKYLDKNDYEIVKGDGDLSPVLPNEGKSLDMVLKGTARIRQKPGSKNSLGGVKFLFPNSYNIYFHDTPSRSAFSKARRDVSHGCIRLSEPGQLAALLLGDQEKWTRAAIDSSMSLEAPMRVAVKKPRPVFILYSTAMAAQDGKTYFYPDIYGYDLELVAKLEKSYPYAH
ncbi:MAG: L,D-transpeptidase family protein, partial [Gemmatimonadaceae bacterium]